MQEIAEKLLEVVSHGHIITWTVCVIAARFKLCCIVRMLVCGGASVCVYACVCVYVCVCAGVCALRIVSRDKILHFKEYFNYYFIIIIIIIAQRIL